VRPEGAAKPMSAAQDYPDLSQWPVNLGRAPDHDLLVQAYALGKRRRSRRALAVAAYLSGHYWWPDDLGVAIDHAKGTPGGAANDPRNVRSCGTVASSPSTSNQMAR
jgi:hypothetical protein